MSSDHSLVFAVIILPTAEKFRYSKETHMCIQRPMNPWDQGCFAELVEDTATDVRTGRQGISQGGSMTSHEDHAAQAYNRSLLSGQIRQVVQRYKIQEGWGVARTG